MPDVRLTRKEEKGKLPAACMCCGDPATDWMDHTFPLHPPRVAGPSAILQIRAIQTLFAMANTPGLRLPTSFCPRHRHYWLLRAVLTWGGVAGMLAVVFGGLLGAILLLTVGKIDSPLLGCCAIVPLFLYLVAWVISLKMVQSRTIRAELAGDGSEAVVLRNVNGRYVEAVLRQRELSYPAARPLSEKPAGAEAPPMAILIDPPPGREDPLPPAEGPTRSRPGGRRGPDPTVVGLSTAAAVLLVLLLLCGVGIKVILLIESMRGDQGDDPRKQAAAPGDVFTKLPPTAPLPAELRERPGVDLIALLDLKKDVVHGPWEIRNGTLYCTHGGFVPRVQFPYLPPEEYDFIVTFGAPGPDTGVSLIMPNPRGGSFFWFVGGREQGDEYGFWGKPLQKVQGLIKKPFQNPGRVPIAAVSRQLFQETRPWTHW